MSIRTSTTSKALFGVPGCSRMEDILRFRESGDAGRGLKENIISAGAESALLCDTLGFEGDDGNPLKIPNEPDFLCLKDACGARARSRSIIDVRGAAIGNSKGAIEGAGERFLDGRRVSAFLVDCKKDDRFLRCIRTGDPGTCGICAAARSIDGSRGSSKTVFETAELMGQL